MTEAEAQDLKAALAELHAAGGIFCLSIRKAAGGSLWKAVVAHKEVEHDRIVHESDPCVFVATHAKGANALRIAMAIRHSRLTLEGFGCE